MVTLYATHTTLMQKLNTGWNLDSFFKLKGISAGIDIVPLWPEDQEHAKWKIKDIVKHDKW